MFDGLLVTLADPDRQIEHRVRGGRFRAALREDILPVGDGIGALVRHQDGALAVGEESALPRQQVNPSPPENIITDVGRELARARIVECQLG